jgi:hypothetical protein
MRASRAEILASAVSWPARARAASSAATSNSSAHRFGFVAQPAQGGERAAGDACDVVKETGAVGHQGFSGVAAFALLSGTVYAC